MRHERRWWMTGLLLAFVLRLIALAPLDPLDPYQNQGGDSGWYLLNGYALAGGTPPADVAVDISSLQPPPVYLLVVGAAQRLFSPADAVIAVRLLQAAVGTLTCACVYVLARRLAGPTAALIGLGIIALSPAFILETGQITTETLYIGFLMAGLMLYVEAVARQRAHWAAMAAVGVLLGLATLTRAVLLLFPVGLALHLFLVYRPRQALRSAAALLVVYSLVVSTWSVYNWARWQRFVIAGEGFASMLYIGAAGWAGPEATDAQLLQDGGTRDENQRTQGVLDAASNVIERDVSGYLQRRLSELASAYLQPHGTTLFPGPSLRDLALEWWRSDRSLSGLAALTQAEGFFPKLLLYLFHYGTLLIGLIGMVLTWRQWRLSLPLVGLIAYITLIHLVLFALPRYIFPIMPSLTVFAAATVGALLHRSRRQERVDLVPDSAG